MAQKVVVDWSKYAQEQDALNAKVNKKSPCFIHLQYMEFQIGNIDLKDGAKNGNTESDESPDEVNLAEASLLKKLVRKGLVSNKNDIEIQRQNPNSPLHSVKTFEALNL